MSSSILEALQTSLQTAAIIWQYERSKKEIDWFRLADAEYNLNEIVKEIKAFK